MHGLYSCVLCESCTPCIIKIWYKFSLLWGHIPRTARVKSPQKSCWSCSTSSHPLPFQHPVKQESELSTKQTLLFKRSWIIRAAYVWKTQDIYYLNGQNPCRNQKVSWQKWECSSREKVLLKYSWFRRKYSTQIKTTRRLPRANVAVWSHLVRSWTITLKNSPKVWEKQALLSILQLS